MSKINIYNLEGKIVAEQELAPAVFEVKTKPELIHLVATGLSANQRQVLAHTKTRGEVSGGGRKPWKQKGTGRARHGSIRSPLWRGGGVAFGPRPERNFKVKINKKAKKAAFRMALSEKVKENGLVLLENFDLPEAKTMAFAKILRVLPVVGKKITIVFSAEKENLRRASRNLPQVSQENLNELNLLDVLRADTILTTREAVVHWEKTCK